MSTMPGVAVIDTATNTVTARVPAGFSSGIAVAPDGRRAYAVNYYAKTLSVIDTATNTVAATFPLADGAVGLALSPDGRRAYVTNYVPDTMSIVPLG